MAPYARDDLGLDGGNVDAENREAHVGTEIEGELALQLGHVDAGVAHGTEVSLEIVHAGCEMRRSACGEVALQRGFEGGIEFHGYAGDADGHRDVFR